MPQSSNFISWFLINQLVSYKPIAPRALTCETVNKSSKSSDCYIDSDTHPVVQPEYTRTYADMFYVYG